MATLRVEQYLSLQLDLDTSKARAAAAALLSGADRLLGSHQDDTLHGLGGNDSLSGSAGEDGLFGDSGHDSLFGGSGADTLTGGAGFDRLSGGTGADRFVFTSSGDSPANTPGDRIADFSGIDRIDLRGIDADATLAGNQAFAFIGHHAFTGEAGELRAGSGLVQADTDGNGRADFTLQVDAYSGGKAILAADAFLL